jgi:hypothetical protein
MLHCRDIEFLSLSVSCVAVSSICAAPFSIMFSTQADNNSRKLWLHCQFPWSPSKWRSRPVQPRADEDAAVCFSIAPPWRIVLVWLEEKTLPVVVLGTLCSFLFHIYTLAWLQHRQLVEWGSSLSTKLQLQHVSINAALSLSGHSYRWSPLHHIRAQWGGYLQLAHARLNFWRL